LVAPGDAVAGRRRPATSLLFALVLLDSEPAALSSVAIVLVARSLVRLLSGRDNVAAAAAAAARLGVHVNGHDRIRVVVSRGLSDDPGPSGAVDVDDVAGASVVGGIAGNDVTISACRKSGGESSVQNAIFVVEGDEGFIAAGKGDLIVSVVPPVIQATHAGSITPFDHISDLSPSVFADPVVTASAIALDGHVTNATVSVGRRTNPIVAASNSSGVGVGAHDLGEAIRISHHKSVGDLVGSRLSVSDDGATTAVTALIVVTLQLTPFLFLRLPQLQP